MGIFLAKQILKLFKLQEAIDYIPKQNNTSNVINPVKESENKNCKKITEKEEITSEKKNYSDSKENKKEEKRVATKGLNKIKSQLILRKIFQHITKIDKMRLLHHNKKFQSKLNLSLGDYKEHNEILVEIELNKVIKGYKN